MRETRSKKSPKAASSSERRNWGNIFNVLVQMVRSQQNQLQSLSTQHKFLEDRLRMQHEAWASDIRLHNDHISQVTGILKFEEKKRSLEAAQADLALGFKHREASIMKWILEHTEDELADFKAWFEILSRKSSNGEDQGTVLKETDRRKKRNTDSEKENKSTGNSTEEEKRSLKIEDDLRRLKEECEKLALEKSSEVSALLAEKKFVWNQYNIMEKDYGDKLRAKQAEVEKADEKIKTLVSNLEQLQSENNKKDSIISQLVSKVANMEAETERLNQEISRLSMELESSRKSRKGQATPILNPCMEGTKNSDLGTSKSGRKRNVTVKKEISTPDAPPPANLSGKGNTSLKRKKDSVILTSETPKLFSSSFKVPKLKPSLRA